MHKQSNTVRISISGASAKQLKKIFQPGFVRALSVAERKASGGRPPVASPHGACPGICPDTLGGRPIKHCAIKALRGGGIEVRCTY